MKMKRAVFGILVSLLLASCGRNPTDDPKKAQMEADNAREVRLLSDPFRARSIIADRLSKVVRVKNGRLVVRGSDHISTFTFPLNTAWSLECGAGLIARFGPTWSEGTWSEGEGGDVSEEGPIVWLSFDFLPQKTCDVVGPVASDEISRLLDVGSKP